MSQSVVELSPKRTRSHHALRELSQAYRNLSLAQIHLKESDAAVKNLETGIQILAHAYGRQNSFDLIYVEDLILQLQALGRDDEANEWRRNRELIMNENCGKVEREEGEKWAEYQAMQGEKQGEDASHLSQQHTASL